MYHKRTGNCPVLEGYDPSGNSYTDYLLFIDFRIFI
jgi:hypothetical protein